MADNIINIAVAGVEGRMGKVLAKAVVEHPALHLAVETTRSKAIESDFDTLIDFTTPEATLINLNFCTEYNKKIIIGTTGFSESQLLIIKQAALRIPIVMSPNMSIGTNLCFKLISQAAKVLDQWGDQLDIDILDVHHRHKVDAPSGTALKMNAIISEQLSQARVPRISSIRAGDVVGDHSVIFSINGERLEFTHKANSRVAFAQGALRAALWLQNKKPGLYSMENVLDS